MLRNFTDYADYADLIAKILRFVSKGGFLPQCRKFNYFNINKHQITAVFWRDIAL